MEMRKERNCQRPKQLFYCTFKINFIVQESFVGVANRNFSTPDGVPVKIKSPFAT